MSCQASTAQREYICDVQKCGREEKVHYSGSRENFENDAIKFQRLAFRRSIARAPSLEPSILSSTLPCCPYIVEAKNLLNAAASAIQNIQSLWHQFNDIASLCWFAIPSFPPFSVNQNIVALFLLKLYIKAFFETF